MRKARHHIGAHIGDSDYFRLAIGVIVNRRPHNIASNIQRVMFFKLHLRLDFFRQESDPPTLGLP